jgi:hypothetical protein
MRPKTLAAAAVLAIVTTACAQAPTESPGGGIDHPTDPATAILKVRFEGGFVPAEYLFTSLPVFALYGDGAVIQPGAQIEIYPAPALPAITTRTIDEDTIQAILQAALDAGLDHDGDYSDMGNMGVADAATTVFELSMDGITHRVTAYALGDEGSQQEGQPDDVWAMRESLNGFLAALPGMLPAGAPGDHVYQGEAAQLLIQPYHGDPDLRQEPLDWPLAIPLADAGTPVAMLGDDATCLVVAGPDWTTLRELADGANQLTPWRQGTARYALTFRPLLPDEPGCALGTD